MILAKKDILLNVFARVIHHGLPRQLKKPLHERDIFKLKAIRSGNVDDWRKFKKSVILQIVKLSLLKRFILTMRLNRIEETCVTLGES